MLRTIIRDFRQLHFALKRYYRRQRRRKLTPVEEAERDIARLHRQQEAARRLMWRR